MRCVSRSSSTRRWSSVIRNSECYTNADLARIATAPTGKGRANALVCLPFYVVAGLYRRADAGRLGRPERLGDHVLDGNVAALFGADS